MKPNFGRLLVGVGALAFVFSAGLTVRAAGTGPDFKGPIGLQLYSLRAQFNKDVPGTLDLLKKWDIKYVELAGTYKHSPEDFKAQLDTHGLKAVSGHFDFNRLRDDVEGVAREAQTLGLKYVGCAWIPHDGPFDEKMCRETILAFNHAGAALAKHGMKFFYHVHGYEFQPYKDGTLLDLLMAETDPKTVHFEMDIFWIVFPGQDPVQLLQKYKGRWELMHLKDMKKGLATGSLSGGTDVANDVTLGAGQIHMPEVLEAAKKAGIKWYFIEDESPTSEEQIPQSLKYLEQVKW